MVEENKYISKLNALDNSNLEKLIKLFLKGFKDNMKVTEHKIEKNHLIVDLNVEDKYSSFGYYYQLVLSDYKLNALYYVPTSTPEPTTKYDRQYLQTMNKIFPNFKNDAIEDLKNKFDEKGNEK
jgi:hypothetical protein